MKDFFISYNAYDRAWAEWIAWHLEEAGYSVLIQAWDFVGNWVLQMDRAMRSTNRTIAVLSPHYLEALYTQPEWAGAVRRDPTGTKDLLIPFRVAECQPDGILAQIVYTDLVGLPEEQALEQLLKRVSGQRGKPDGAPSFPPRAGVPPARRSVPQRPPYPAEEEDLLRLQRFRVIARNWRDRYAARIDALRHAARQAEALRSALPTAVNEELARVVELAADAADDFSRLPVDELAFAKAYGLQIHGAVLGGSAIALVRSAHRNIKRMHESGQDTPEELDEALGETSPVTAYELENAGRVLEAAVALSSFDVARLPRGFVDAGGPEPPKDLRACPLVIATTDDERLRLLAPSRGPQVLGAFAARTLALKVVAAQVNTKGSLDLVATDAHHLYYWADSGSAPVQQASLEPHVIAGAFVSEDPGSEAVTVAYDGSIRTFSPEGLGQTITPARAPRDIEDAAVWVDPLDPQQWYVLLAGRNGDLLSLQRGQIETYRSSQDLWDDAALTRPRPDPLWTSNVRLMPVMLDGLPCILVERGSRWGSALCFVDPSTLQTLRRPKRLPKDPTHHLALTVANGRWLVGTSNPIGEPSPRVVVWDLATQHKGAELPAGAWFDAVGDVFDPVVLAETGRGFSATVVLHHFEPGPKQNRSSLCMVDWPACTTRFVAEYSHLRIWPVKEATPRR